MMLTDQFNILHHSTVNLSQFTLQADPNKIPHKICFNMPKQNEMKDFPQNSRRAKNVAINPILEGGGQICPPPPAGFLNIAQKPLGLGS